PRERAGGGDVRLLRQCAARVAQVQADLRRLSADQQELRRSMMNGYNFTNDVRMVLAGAREEAAALSHEYVGTEHILLSLLRVHGTVALSVLENLGVNPDEIRDHVLGAVKRGTAARTGPD